MGVTEAFAIGEVAVRLEDLTGLDVRRTPRPHREVDGEIGIGPYTFYVEWKSASDAVAINQGLRILQRLKLLGPHDIPLLAVPYMGATGQMACKAAGRSWIDLSGNADIQAPGLRISVEGRPNAYKRPGRPTSLFAPKGARIAHWFLQHPGQLITQRELANVTGLTEGFVSKVVARMTEKELLGRTPDRRLALLDPQLLLAAYRDEYDFQQHHVIKGHVATRSGEGAVRELSSKLQDLDARHAFTGLAAAWLMTRFAGFRLVTLYLEAAPTPADLVRLGFRAESKGANTWLVLPRDPSVFDGEQRRDGVPCVHPVQAYLDLKGMPERASEAAEHLLQEIRRGNV